MKRKSLLSISLVLVIVMVFCSVSFAISAALQLDKSSLNLMVGSSYTLKANMKVATFSTSNVKIATVSSKGVVKGIALGKATITVKATNGKLAKCAVTVVPALKATTLKIFFPGDAPKAQDEVNAAIATALAKDNLKFKLEFTYAPWDQYWNKQGLIAASGEAYDLTWTYGISSFVAKKVVAPLDSALKNYGSEIMASTPSYCWKEVSVDGKIYAIPRVMPVSDSSFITIRKDLREKYNIPEIKTMADFSKYLEAIKTNNPEMVPMASVRGDAFLREYGNYMFPVANCLNSPGYIDLTDSNFKVKNFFESKAFVEIMKQMRDWNAKGYCPSPDEETAKVPDIEGALNSGKLGATWGVLLKVTERIDAFKSASPNGNLENVLIAPQKPIYLLNTTDNLLSVFSTSKHVNETVAFVNWFRSNQTNFDLFSLGIKDVNYKLDGSAVSYNGIAPEHSYIPISWAWNDIRFARFSKFISPAYAKQLKEWNNTSKTTKLTGFVFNQEPVKTEIAQLTAVMNEYIFKLYNAKNDWDSNMEQFKKELGNANIDKVLAEMQKQVDAYKVK